jgi:hypothetical protein
MKVKNIALLAAALMVIAATGIGNAFAYTWNSGTDSSKLVGSPSVSWVGQTIPDNTPYPTVSYPGTVTWANKFDSEWYGYSYYPTIFTTDSLGGWWKQNGNALSYGQTWEPTGSAGVAYAYGDIPVTVTHRWGAAYDGNDARVTASVIHYHE